MKQCICLFSVCLTPKKLKSSFYAFSTILRYFSSQKPISIAYLERSSPKNAFVPCSFRGYKSVHFAIVAVLHSHVNKKLATFAAMTYFFVNFPLPIISVLSKTFPN
jgi:hypothetical protein